MKPIKILVVENELITGANISGILQKSGYEVTDITSSGTDAIKAVNNRLPDIILMDIELDGPMDGVSTAKTIKQLYDIPIIFITKWLDNDTFANAKQISPQNYITKPFTESVLIRAIELAIHNEILRVPVEDSSNLKCVADGIFIPTTKGYKTKLLFKNILYVEANGAYCKIYFEKCINDQDSNLKVKSIDHYDISLNSNQVVKQLDYKPLIKVHKSYYVNVNKVDKITAAGLFIGNIEIPVGRKYGFVAMRDSIKMLKYD